MEKMKKQKRKNEIEKALCLLPGALPWLATSASRPELLPSTILGGGASDGGWSGGGVERPAEIERRRAEAGAASAGRRRELWPGRERV
jgi:hypothetical protein